MNSKFGNTINEIKSDGILAIHSLSVSKDFNQKDDMCFQTADVIRLVSKNLVNLQPDYLIVLGDRIESFGAAVAAHILGIKIIHLHGGETSLGSLDDKLRHSISQLSTLHFTSAGVHKKKVSDILGSSKNVFDVGPMVIDGLLNLNNLSKKQFENKTGFVFSQKNFFITFHPETLSDDLGISGLKNLLQILENLDCNILFTAPNADAGSDLILKIIDKFISNNKKKCFYISSLGQELYLNGLLLFDCIIGNSSSGIIEAPLLNKKVLNIGNRQKNRYRFGRVTDVHNDKQSISKALKEIFEISIYEKFSLDEFKEKFKDKSPSKKIINFLKDYHSQ